MSKNYTIGQFSKRVNVSRSTLRRMDRSGQFSARRRKSGHRYYSEQDAREFLGLSEGPRKTVVYCRVSGRGQLDDLLSQKKAMESYCLNAGIAVTEWVEEVGGGMNFKRKKFLALMADIIDGKISTLIVAHKDRLVRFGFDLLDYLASRYGCEILVVNQESLSPQQEMIEDLLAIVHTFSCRLYGMRRYKKTE